jgi:predicted RecB family nuclease
MKKSTRDDIQTIPGVGPSIADYLRQIGIRSVTDLRGQSPQRLYDRICLAQGQRIDRCLLYVMRCAVYFASHQKHDPKKLKWWSWKDKK